MRGTAAIGLAGAATGLVVAGLLGVAYGSGGPNYKHLDTLAASVRANVEEQVARLSPGVPHARVLNVTCAPADNTGPRYNCPVAFQGGVSASEHVTVNADGHSWSRTSGR